MSSRKIMAIATALMFIIELFLVSVCGQFVHWQEVVFVVPMVLVALMAGIDLTRRVLAFLPQPKLAEVRANMIIIAAFLFAPLPAMILLYLLTGLVADGKVGTVDSLFEAWRVATALSILHGFLHLAHFPNSFRSLWRRWRESIDDDQRFRAVAPKD